MSDPAPPNEPQRWLDRPENVRRLLRWFFIGCGFWLALDVVFWFGWVDKHAHFAMEEFPFFHCLAGFAGCVAIVLIARALRKPLMRDEDYYDR